MGPRKKEQGLSLPPDRQIRRCLAMFYTAGSRSTESLDIFICSIFDKRGKILDVAACRVSPSKPLVLRPRGKRLTTKSGDLARAMVMLIHPVNHVIIFIRVRPCPKFVSFVKNLRPHPQAVHLPTFSFYGIMLQVNLCLALVCVLEGVMICWKAPSSRERQRLALSRVHDAHLTSYYALRQVSPPYLMPTALCRLSPADRGPVPPAGVFVLRSTLLLHRPTIYPI